MHRLIHVVSSSLCGILGGLPRKIAIRSPNQRSTSFNGAIYADGCGYSTTQNNYQLSNRNFNSFYNHLYIPVTNPGDSSSG